MLDLLSLNLKGRKEPRNCFHSDCHSDSGLLHGGEGLASVYDGCQYLIWKALDGTGNLRKGHHAAGEPLRMSCLNNNTQVLCVCKCWVRRSSDSCLYTGDIYAKEKWRGLANWLCLALLLFRQSAYIGVKVEIHPWKLHSIELGWLDSWDVFGDPSFKVVLELPLSQGRLMILLLWYSQY